MSLIILTWHWGTKYGQEYVDRLAAGVARYYRQSYRWMVCEPDPADHYLTAIPGCFCRLRMFDPVWQREHGIERDDRIVCLDLDAIVTGPLEPLFARPDSLAILQDCNTDNPCPYNGSVIMLRAGKHADIWSDFSLAAAQKTNWYAFPDDQAWIWRKRPQLPGWRAGAASGIYGFLKRGWPRGILDLPFDARLVVFPGRRDPAQYVHLPWVQEKWLKATEGRGHIATPAVD